MRALSLSQPWAWVVVWGGKRVENRPWPLPPKVKGQRVAIHAALSWDQKAFFDLCTGVYGEIPHLPRRWERYERGKIIGTAVPSGMVVGRFGPAPSRTAGMSEFDYAEDDSDAYADRLALPDDQARFYFGEEHNGKPNYGFLLDSVAPIAPVIPCRGALGFWTLPVAVDSQVAEQVADQREHGRLPARSP